MNSLPINTKHRLQRIPQIPHVWEGDRLPIAEMMDNLEPDLAENGECIIWVDGSEGFVRVMEVVQSPMGHEAMVRSLLKAIETPHNPAQPARPQKIVVRNRELQFFLRGVLQDLDIKVDYEEELPLLDELWRNFQNLNESEVLGIRPELMAELEETVIAEIWQEEPWEFLAESDILSIKINYDNGNTDQVYACVMGMMGQEFGVILYRSLESLKKFRQMAIDITDSASESEIESTFLNQDCWFVNFNPLEDEDEDDEDYNDAQAIFGSIHPYEGIRPLRDEEEFAPVYFALKSLGEFICDYQFQLNEEPIPKLHEVYQMISPVDDSFAEVTVETLPELTNELEDMFDDEDDDEYDDDYDDDDDDEDYVIANDLIPNGTIISFAMLDEHFLNLVSNQTFSLMTTEKFDKTTTKKISKHGLPCVIVQTTRPKAKVIIDKIREEGGVKHILFNQGFDSDTETFLNLGVIQTDNNQYHLFGEFPQSDTDFSKAYTKWEEKMKLVDDYCGFVIAMGVTGASKGDPRTKDILAIFSAKFTTTEQLGLPEIVYG